MEILELPEGFLIGADPELFMFRDGAPVSAHETFPGTKSKPFPVNGGAIQVDGTAAEFNIDPAATFEQFTHNIDSVIAEMRNYLAPNEELRTESVVVWPEEYFAGLPFVARELGCMPDFDAWTGRRNPKPSLKAQPTLRTAAGHIHIGFTTDADMRDPRHIINCQRMIRLMDWHVGTWASSIDAAGATRRQLYGKAGACRYKTYGVEYRTPSNFWVMHEEHRATLWNLIVLACRDFGESREISTEMGEDIIRIVNQIQ